MTNEENINNAATNYGYAVAGGCIDRGYIQDAFEAGAKWKDQQFKEYLKKKKEYYYEKRNSSFLDTSEIHWKAKEEVIDEIINELFKED